MSKRKTIAELQAEIVKVSKQSDDNYASGRKWKELAEEHEKRVKEVREQFVDLKKRLHDSEVENARLSGYQQRVHEDDIVRDGFVEVTDAETGKTRTIPRRPSQEQFTQPSNFESPSYDGFGRKREFKHWTSY